VTKLLNRIIDLLRLRAGPEDMPSSWSTALGLISAYLMLGIITGQQLGSDDSSSAALAGVAMQFTAVIVMLKFRKFPERLPQTLSALAGVGIIFTFLSFAFLSQADPDKQQPVLALAWFGIFFWSLAVDAHIYRKALSITMAQGMLIAVLLLAGSYVMVEFLFNMPQQ
jgi:hypothetical protein